MGMIVSWLLDVAGDGGSIPPGYTMHDEFWQEEFCEEHQGGAYSASLGTCSCCGCETPSMSFKYCYNCALEHNSCVVCGKELEKE
jgi:hypothetical protein